VGNEQPSLEPGEERVRQFGKGGGCSHHGVADARQLLDEGADLHARVHQAAPAFLLFAIHQHHADFGDAIRERVGAGGFQVHEGEGGGNFHGEWPDDRGESCRYGLY